MEGLTAVLILFSLSGFSIETKYFKLKWKGLLQIILEYLF